MFLGSRAGGGELGEAKRARAAKEEEGVVLGCGLARRHRARRRAEEERDARAVILRGGGLGGAHEGHEPVSKFTSLDELVLEARASTRAAPLLGDAVLDVEHQRDGKRRGEREGGFAWRSRHGARAERVTPTDHEVGYLPSARKSADKVVFRAS